VTGELGTLCGGYQLMNEPNNPIYGFFPPHDCATAVIEGASVIRSSHPAASVAVNISMDIWGWRKYLCDLLHSSATAVDLIGLDHYPGTWTIGRNAHWDAAVDIADEIASATPASIWFNRHLAIMETGYSTNTPLRSDNEQIGYFRGVQQVVARINSKPSRTLPLFGIYELCDGNSRALLDPEAHFGVMTSDFRPKAAFAPVAQMITTL
jgi:hypothetical protein